MFIAKISDPNASTPPMRLTQREEDFQVLSIAGLAPVDVQLNTSPMAGQGIALLNSATVGTRNIVITLKLRGDIVLHRNNLYNWLPTKSLRRFYIQNSWGNYWIDGYVEKVECDLFSNNETMQISLICLDPYFKSEKETYQLATWDLESGTYYKIYTGTKADTESVITIQVKKAFEDLIITKVDLITEKIAINYPFAAKDVITIDGTPGAKKVELQRNGNPINLISKINKNAVFPIISNPTVLTLETGSAVNDLSYIDFVISYYPKFLGV